MIQTTYDTTMNVLRLADSEGGGEAYQAYLSSVACHIQPLDDSFSQTEKGNEGKESLCFCDSLDIREKDHVVSEGLTYEVVSVERFRVYGRVKHMEMRVRRYL